MSPLSHTAKAGREAIASARSADQDADGLPPPAVVARAVPLPASGTRRPTLHLPHPPDKADAQAPDRQVLEARASQILPFGGDDQRVGALQSLGLVGQLDVMGRTDAGRSPP